MELQSINGNNISPFEKDEITPNTLSEEPAVVKVQQQQSTEELEIPSSQGMEGSPLATIIAEMRAAVPFNEYNARLIKFFKDPDAKKQDGELFISVKQDCADIYFFVKGTCQHPKPLAIDPKVVPSARRYVGVKNDRYAVKATLGDLDVQDVQKAKKCNFWGERNLFVLLSLQPFY